jgi:hypothetical protein
MRFGISQPALGPPCPKPPLPKPDRSMLQSIHTPTNRFHTMTSHTSRVTRNSKATAALAARIQLILSNSPRPMRQFEIARAMDIPEHNDWSTHACLKALVEAGDVRLIETRVPTSKGSKNPTRILKTYTNGNPPRVFNNVQSTQQLKRSPLDWVARQILRMTTR